MLKTHFRTAPLKLASVLTLGLLLGACGGGSGSQVGSKGGISSSSASTSSVDTTQIRNLGRGTGTDFVSGEIDVGIGSDTLSAGGTTILTVNAVSGSGNLVTETFDVTFNSACIASGEATLSKSGELTPDGTVTTTNGQASISYTANGCTGSDQITATASYKGEVLSASSTIVVEADTLGSIQFVDATPSLISLKGTGGSEISVVRFQAKGSSNSPIKNVCVEFSLNTNVGGVELVDSKCETSDPAGSKKAKTDINGYASITVKSGSVAAPIAITAKDSNSGLSTQSRNLRVSTGVPDQKSMSLGATVSNPSGWNYDGEEVHFTIRLADAFNNPPPPGTVVSFTASGGSIDESCSTDEDKDIEDYDGSCSVTWRSQSPRPDNGRVRILAHTVGNESFKDTNGNGWYDLDVDVFAAPHSNASCKYNTPPSTAAGDANACDDLPEAYLDANLNGVRDNNEFFIDFDQSQTHNSVGDGNYNGVLCRTADEANGKCTRNGVTIREDAYIVMSSDNPLLINGRLPEQNATLSVAAKAVVQMHVLLADINGNALPAGTVVTILKENSKDLDVSPASLTIPSGTQAQYMSVILVGSSDTDKASGLIQFEIKSPKGLITTSGPTVFN